MLWNCEKEEGLEKNINSSIPIEQIKKQFNQEFETKFFPYLKKEPLWDKVEISIYQGKKYYEIPFYDIQKIDRTKSTSVSLDKIVAFKNDNNIIELNVIHFFVPKINSFTSNTLSLESIETTDVFVSFYDLKNNVLDVKRYINGKESIKKYKVKEVEKDINKLYPKMPTDEETCETITEEWVTETCYFWNYSDGSIEIINCFYDYFTKEYTSCDGTGGYTGETVVREELEVQIIDSLNNVCAENILKKLKEKGSDYSVVPKLTNVNHLSQTILDLFSSSTTHNLTFRIDQLGFSNGNRVNGRTEPVNNGWQITIDTDLVEKGTKLFIAKTMIHETMHAYINFNLKTNATSDLVTDLNSIYQKFKSQNNSFSLTHHEFMGEYVDALASSLAIYDDNNHSLEYYKMLSWGGLETSSAYQALSSSKKTEIQNAIINERDGKSNAKGEKCN
ncbi:MAG: hypothetical protein HWD85_04850 [Flavobacteriaceae bacterium]|nr:hypothetical protein [Flavobacteriaceae bacterium]